MEQAYTFSGVSRKPSAFVPIAMSVSALLMVLSVIFFELATQGQVVREADEGAVAHLWQTLMTVQMPIVLFFAVKWLRRAPQQAWGVIALQAGAWLASCALVFLFHL